MPVRITRPQLARTRAPVGPCAQKVGSLRCRARPADAEGVTAMAVNAERRAVRRSLRSHRANVGAERVTYVLSPCGVLAALRHVGNPTAPRTRNHATSVFQGDWESAVLTSHIAVQLTFPTLQQRRSTRGIAAAVTMAVWASRPRSFSFCWCSCPQWSSSACSSGRQEKTARRTERCRRDSAFVAAHGLGAEWQAFTSIRQSGSWSTHKTRSTRFRRIYADTCPT